MGARSRPHFLAMCKRDWPVSGRPALPCSWWFEKRPYEKSPVPVIPGCPIFLLLPQLAIVTIFFLLARGRGDPVVLLSRRSVRLRLDLCRTRQFHGHADLEPSMATRRAVHLRSSPCFVTFLSLGIALLLAVKADKVLRGASTYKTLADVGLCGRPAGRRPSSAFCCSTSMSARWSNSSPSSAGRCRSASNYFDTSLRDDHDSFGLETGAGQLHLLPVRSSGHLQVGPGSGQHRLPLRPAPVLDRDLPAAGADRVLPA